MHANKYDIRHSLKPFSITLKSADLKPLDLIHVMAKTSTDRKYIAHFSSSSVSAANSCMHARKKDLWTRSQKCRSDKKVMKLRELYQA